MARVHRRDRPAEWLRQGERGAVLWIELATLVATGLGRPAARTLARAIAAYYLVFDRGARRDSRAWLERVHGRPARLREVYRHVSCFAQVTMDRLFFARQLVAPAFPVAHADPIFDRRRFNGFAQQRQRFIDPLLVERQRTGHIEYRRMKEWIQP